ncbi:MAG: 16S rRNA (guanine(966)-N(2))-methyltransferase RsmD [bacterium]
MRVISGKAKGRKLKSPFKARPLTDRVKGALFNILRGRIADSSFLDLFAGSGAVGIEAISNGAKSAVFVELNPQNTKVIVENLDKTELTSLAKVLRLDAVSALNLLAKQGLRFDIIYLGAPYEDPALEECLAKISSLNLLAEKGLVIAEHRKQHFVRNKYGMLEVKRENNYGETVLKFYEKSNLSWQF